jgi:hypothetical protein
VAHFLKVTAAAILSLGWAVPMYLSVQFLAEWNRLVLAAGSAGEAARRNSFPFITASEQLATVAVVWASVAILAWASWGAWSNLRKGREA